VFVFVFVFVFVMWLVVLLDDRVRTCTGFVSWLLISGAPVS
jgi:hypothetical protein